MNLAQNNTLRNKISERVKEIFTTNAALIKDAEERKMKLDPTRLSRYFKGKPGGITDEQVLWIATRVGIQVHVNFGSPIIEDGKLKYEIQPYDELKSLTRLKKIFGE